MYNQAFGVTLFVFFASFLLSVIISMSYLRSRSKSVMFWASGMWLFAIASFFEVIFAAGIFNAPLLDAYLFLVAVLVQFLSLGSLLLMNSRKLNWIYGIYSIAVDALLIIFLATSGVGNIILNGVVYGSIPVTVIIGSSLITFPAAVILVVVSIMSYRKKRDWRLLSIIFGTVVVSAAGGLYIASFPSFLYVAELVGIVLLWMGFVDFSKIPLLTGVKKHVHG